MHHALNLSLSTIERRKQNEDIKHGLGKIFGKHVSDEELVSKNI
jgi:hypothetical protein